MGYVSSEEGMRFNRLWCGTSSGYHRAGTKNKSVLIKLRWLTDDEKGIIAYWNFYGQTAEIAEAKCDQKLHDISLVCEGYTLHKYFLAGDLWKYAGTSCCSICRPEKEEANKCDI